MRRPALRRNALTKAMSKRDYSQRRGRACSLITVDPRTWRYASYRPCDTEVRGLPRHLACATMPVSPIRVGTSFWNAKE